MGGVGLSGRVTWENFLEALGERFGWVLVALSELASLPRSSKKVSLVPQKI